MEFSVKAKNNLIILGTNFLPSLHLHCYCQVDSIFTFNSHQSAHHLLLKCLLQIETRKIHVRIVVPKLQNLILPVTRGVVLLVHCIEPSVPISPQNPKMIGTTIFLRSTVAQNLMTPSNVTFIIEKFQDFRLYVNIETLNTECRWDQEQEMSFWNI